jgi:hypothetical protein
VPKREAFAERPRSPRSARANGSHGSNRGSNRRTGRASVAGKITRHRVVHTRCPDRHVGGTSRSASAPIAAFVIWADTECRAHRLPGVRRPGGSTELRRCMVPRQPPSANLPIADAEWSPDGHPTPKFWETPGRARLAPPNAGSAAALNGSRSDGGWLQIRSPMLTVRFPSASSRLPTCPGRARLHPQLVMDRPSSDRTHSGLRRSGTEQGADHRLRRQGQHHPADGRAAGSQARLPSANADPTGSDDEFRQRRRSTVATASTGPTRPPDGMGDRSVRWWERRWCRMPLWWWATIPPLVLSLLVSLLW